MQPKRHARCAVLVVALVLCSCLAEPGTPAAGGGALGTAMSSAAPLPQATPTLAALPAHTATPLPTHVPSATPSPEPPLMPSTPPEPSPVSSSVPEAPGLPPVAGDQASLSPVSSSVPDVTITVDNFFSASEYADQEAIQLLEAANKAQAALTLCPTGYTLEAYSIVAPNQLAPIKHLISAGH